MSLSLPEYKPMPLPNGIYAPIPTAFTQDEELDVEATVKHALRLARAGIGLVVAGSTGEAIAMTGTERAQVVYAIRKTLQAEHLTDTPIVAGTGGGSVRETVALSQEAKDAGADAVIVIAPGYFAGALQSNRAVLKDFYWNVADASPLPVMLYNFPAASGGIDMDSALLEEIAEHSNVCGAKLTCAGVGKLGRLANGRAAKEKRQSGQPFHVFPGYADILLPCMMLGASGAIVGTANVVPRLCRRHYEDIEAFLHTPNEEGMVKIRADQDVISRFDSALASGGVAATKYVVGRYYSAMGVPRRPLPITDAETFMNSHKDVFQLTLALERALEEDEGVVVSDRQKM